MFTELGARPDLDRLAGLTGLLGQPAVDGLLSQRERDVLAHVAAGKTNREIAADLTISQHTVGRHVEDIFAKLGVTNPSRGHRPRLRAPPPVQAVTAIGRSPQRSQWSRWGIRAMRSDQPFRTVDT